MKALHDIKEPLEELNNMIGMKELKSNIVDQILYFIQDLHINKDATGEFLHTVIYGPPGTGKTEIAKIMGKIYSKIGILSKGTFKKVTRSDLVAGYLGQTALKTREVIKEALGGVLFIDEAYSLGNPEKKDSFSKECIDTLCESLSDHKSNLMVIIAGYEKELKECFFSFNQGLDSRFTWRFKTDTYTHEDLYKIFLKKTNDIGWEIDTQSNITAEWFKTNKDCFKFFGRDIETLLSKTKIAHSRRVFCKSDSEKKKITIKDLDKGFEVYLKNDDIKNKREEEEMKRYLYNTLYC
jgi:SpoVK/Ycf46/Vps4 family AAA+-type ATPase